MKNGADVHFSRVGCWVRGELGCLSTLAAGGGNRPRGREDARRRRYHDCSPRSLPLRIAIRPNGGSITGKLENCAATTVLLLPQEESLWDSRFIDRGACDAGRTVEAGGLRPAGITRRRSSVSTGLDYLAALRRVAAARTRCRRRRNGSQLAGSSTGPFGELSPSIRDGRQDAREAVSLTGARTATCSATRIAEFKSRN
jgi:hypothetical protein